jgi:Carboxypeptidase regulatory-like domain
VTLVHNDDVAVRVIQSGSGGEFTMENLAAGVFRLTVTAQGFASFSSEQITVADGQVYAQPTITL